MHRSTRGWRHQRGEGTESVPQCDNIFFAPPPCLPARHLRASRHTPSEQSSRSTLRCALVFIFVRSTAAKTNNGMTPSRRTRRSTPSSRSGTRTRTSSAQRTPTHRRHRALLHRHGWARNFEAGLPFFTSRGDTVKVASDGDIAVQDTLLEISAVIEAGRRRLGFFLALQTSGSFTRIGRRLLSCG